MSMSVAPRALLFLLFAFAAACSPPESPSQVRADGLLPVTIVTGGARHEYLVEVARTPAEQARGLMYRQDLGADRGMIFPYDPPAPQGFWMKNTYVPLDIIFIAPDGTIESIAADTVPLSTGTYESKGAVKAVLELNAGEAARIGAGPGDPVIYELQSAP